jgi:diguanylate cyclase (GGDEF)-like protein
MAAATLNKLLGQSKHVKGLVEEAAEELAGVNEVLQNDVEARQAGPGVEAAVEKSGEIEDKVKDASDKLEVVNRALHDEVEQRHLLEGELVEAAERGEVHRQASLHDPLTGLPNRALFDDRLAHGLAQAQRQGWPLAVLFGDLDGFKAINDTHGHAAGDLVLQTVAARLVANARQEDTVSRYGGDEFVLVLAGSLNEQGLEALGRKLLAAVRSPIALAETDPPARLEVGISLGIAIFPQDGKTPGELVASADAAMFVAKRAKSGLAFALREKPSA